MNVQVFAQVLINLLNGYQVIITFAARAICCHTKQKAFFSQTKQASHHSQLCAEMLDQYYNMLSMASLF